MTSQQIIVVSIVCRHYGVDIDEFTHKNKRRQCLSIVEMKQTAAYLLHEYGATNRQAARLLGYPQRSSVVRGRKKVIEIASVNKEYRELIARLDGEVKKWQEVTIGASAVKSIKKPKPRPHQLSLF